MKLLQSLLLALGLSLSALSAQAAVIYNFSGAVDAEPVSAQSGQGFSGSFSFDDVAADFDGTVSLTSFHLNFLGQVYGLGDADFEPLAYFSAGQFLGVDFVDFDDDSRASVGLTAGFFDLTEAFFSYGSSAAGVEGMGSVAFEREVVAAVPLPGTLALAGLGLLALSRRRRA